MQVRRQQERDLDEARPLVATLFDELGEASAVVARLEGDPTLRDGLRREAKRELLRVSLARQAPDSDPSEKGRFFFLRNEPPDTP